jgi:hypothetical protein
MPQLEEEGPDGTLFQAGGAPLHFHEEVTDFLNFTIPQKWIDRGGPVTWPPRSPDPTTGLRTCGPNLNTVMGSAMPLMVPAALNVCETLVTKLDHVTY